MGTKVTELQVLLLNRMNLTDALQENAAHYLCYVDVKEGAHTERDNLLITKKSAAITAALSLLYLKFLFLFSHRLQLLNGLPPPQSILHG